MAPDDSKAVEVARRDRTVEASVAHSHTALAAQALQLDSVPERSPARCQLISISAKANAHKTAERVVEVRAVRRRALSTRRAQEGEEGKCEQLARELQHMARAEEADECSWRTLAAVAARGKMVHTPR